MKYVYILKNWDQFGTMEVYGAFATAELAYAERQRLISQSPNIFEVVDFEVEAVTFTAEETV